MKNLKLFWCEKLHCKLTKEGCKSLQKRAKLQRLFDSGVINEKTIRFLFDPLPNVPCLSCSNPISKLQ